MPTMSEITDGFRAGFQHQHVLQEDADSTVAGGQNLINYDGEYVYAVRGTLDTAEPSLYVQRVGTTGFNIAKNNTGTAATLTEDGTAASVLLCRGDVVYSQSTVVGGSSDFTTVLNFNNS